MADFPILSVMMLVPLLAAVACLLVEAKAARQIALVATLIDLALGVLLWVNYDIGGAQWQFHENVPLFAGFSWALGIDGIALMLIMLSVFLMPICILASASIEKRVGEYMAAFLLMETLMIGVFAAQDIFLFYIMFEAGLIPMYLIIGIWGGADRIYASYKFFLYTLIGSVLMLIAMLWMVNEAGTTDIPTLMEYNFAPEVQTWLWLAFFASFAVKMPMWPVHTWLPDAHVQAPTAGSVILAGVLLKMGGYGFIRFSLPMFPEASAQFAWLVFALSMVAVIYTSLVALVQNDMKKLIAYSSVAHMAIVTIGLFAFNPQGLEGAMVVMLSHGLVSGALFLCVGVIYDRLHTREIDRYGGLSINMPYYALFFMLFTMASIGLPGTSGFVGEFLSLAGIYQVSSWVALVCTTGIILGAAYMLYLYRRVCFGEQKNADAAAMPDLNRREWWLMAPIAAVVLWMGVYPESFLAPMRADIAVLDARIARAKPESDAQLTAGKPKPANATEHTAHGEAH
ncbi:NADH-quinone oxidoreductase subunit M [Novosphingobium sp.]|jgi:NADH-quinone oxidoreductase subunit M|uniref:NADH-quinone oxidoreductase subunit M n=1 Tax=Novosphingobium sp. TaxID=1874826 RepID=UPI0022C6ACC8|nr:NADH-quinone oxidoreductase subunit M [Novosphingobium sp.]MCZ8017394.1 NADH-quinone oxidoreductase subunit M [Novosphingobium sp.]MCZ8034083.1 NADH-quinone oxidoreductase subunit M [Novosphingobium sp.]MCZ8051438.1 NADH-quinone oxidoreductase subunit M [Novosphingobium sp.]MCZ8059784.1 NADH-quinone oxidoreductase subunit M [Novosphingobium sp.]MCZ8231622.1 NADH-quinone oxidoreductase subunit M [Novosphingobium sp.]